MKKNFKKLSLLVLVILTLFATMAISVSAEVKDTDVAKIGEKGYATLAEALAAANAIEGGATVNLLADVTIGEQLTITGNVTISGAYTITRADTYTGTLFVVKAGATLTLDDGLVIDGGNNYAFDRDAFMVDAESRIRVSAEESAKWFTPEEGAPVATAFMITTIGGTINLKNVTVQNNYSINSGVISAGANSTITLTGAKITHIACIKNSGVVANVSGANINVTVNDGTIIDSNHVGGNHGIFKIYSGAVLTMNGGEIKNTTGWNSNGVVVGIYWGSFYMNGGAICSNTGVNGPDNGRNAAIYGHRGHTFVMNGGTICHNSGAYGGLDAPYSNGKTEIHGGAIVNNVSFSGNKYHDINASSGLVITGGTFTQNVSNWLAPNTGLAYNEETGTYGTVTEALYKLHLIDPMTGETPFIPYIEGNDLASLVAQGKAFYANYYKMTLEILYSSKVDKTVVIDYPMTINLNGCTLTGVNKVYPVIRVQGDANVTITGGGKIINATDYVFVLGASDSSSAGKLTIENGEFIGQTTVISVTKGQLTINGGKFECVNGPYGSDYLINCVDANYKNGEAQVSIKGGSFTGFNPTNNATEGTGTNFCADGYIVNDLGDGVYGVIEAIVEVNGKYFATLEEAFAAAKDGDTIVLLKDITYTKDDVVNAIGGATGFGKYPNPCIISIGGTAGNPNNPSSVDAVIDLNGHTLKNTADAYFFMIMDNAKVTFTDSVGGGKVITTADAPAVWVIGTDTLVTIKKGYFETASEGGVLHSTHGGDLVIEGGEFNTTAAEKSLLIMLNSKDRNNSKFFISGVATVTIKGGIFHGFNPTKVGDDNGATSIEDIKFVDACPETYAPIENEDGSYGVQDLGMSYVKWVRAELYAGRNVVLTKDIVIDGYDLVYVPKLTSNRYGKYDISYGEGAIFYIIKDSVTLDLNGHSITWNAHDEYFCGGVATSLFRVTVEGAQKNGKVDTSEFTVKDSTGTGAVTIYGRPAAMYSTFTYATANIAGGKWTNYPCKDCNATGYFIYPSHGSTMNIIGGTFQQITADGISNKLLGWQGSTQEGAQNYLCDYSKTQLNITGGTFVDFNPSEVKFIDYAGTDKETENGCADGFAPVDNGDGTFGVVKAVAKIGDTYYESLAEAITASKNGDTIVLLADAETPYDFKFGFNRTYKIDLNGHTWAPYANTIQYCTSVYVTDSVGGGKITPKIHFNVGQNSELHIAKNIAVNFNTIRFNAPTAIVPQYGRVYYGDTVFTPDQDKATFRVGSFSLATDGKGGITLKSGTFTLGTNATVEGLTVNKDATLSILKGSTLTLLADGAFTVEGKVQGEGTIAISSADHFVVVKDKTSIKNIKLAQDVDIPKGKGGNVMGNYFVDLGGYNFSFYALTVYTGGTLNFVGNGKVYTNTAHGYDARLVIGGGRSVIFAETVEFEGMFQFNGTSGFVYVGDKCAFAQGNTGIFNIAGSNSGRINVSITNGAKNIALNSGMFTLSENYTINVDTLTVGTKATVVIPAEKTLTLSENTQMVVDGAITVNGKIELCQGATLKAGERLNVVTTVGNSCVYYIDGVYSVKAHTPVVIDAVAPTCTATGLTEGSKCSNCNNTLVEQEEVAALGHSTTCGHILGSGTEIDPYVIYNVEALIAFRTSVNAGETKYNAPGVWVVLGADIDLDGAAWSYISTFYGKFDGKNHTISNFTIDATTGHAAFFYKLACKNGVTPASVENLTLSDVTANVGKNCRVAALVVSYNKTDINNVTVKNFTVTTTGATSWIAGLACAGTVNSEVTMSNCTVENFTVNDSYGAQFIAGITAVVQRNGSDANGTNVLDNLHVKNFKITVNGIVANGSSTAVGGLIGQTQSVWQNPHFKNCSVTDLDVTATGRVDVGGFMAHPGSYTYATNCTVEGKIDVTGVTSSANYVGGFFGDYGWGDNVRKGDHKITNCSAKVDIITNVATAGGFVGSGINTENRNKNIILTNCKAEGTVTCVEGGTATIGGFAGNTDRGIYNGCSAPEGTTFIGEVLTNSNTNNPKVACVAAVNNIYYATLADALTAAKTGETITLVDNVVVDGDLIIEKSITIKLNGKNITADGLVAFVVVKIEGTGKIIVNNNNVAMPTETSKDAVLVKTGSTNEGKSIYELKHFINQARDPEVNGNEINVVFRPSLGDAEYNEDIFAGNVDHGLKFIIKIYAVGNEEDTLLFEGAISQAKIKEAYKYTNEDGSTTLNAFSLRIKNVANGNYRITLTIEGAAETSITMELANVKVTAISDPTPAPGETGTVDNAEEN